MLAMSDEVFTYRYFIIDHAVPFRVLLDDKGRERGAEAPDRKTKKLIFANGLLSRKLWSSWVDEIDEARFVELCAEIYARPEPVPQPECPPDPNEVVFAAGKAPYYARTVSFRIDHKGDALMCDEGPVDWYMIVRAVHVPALHAALKVTCGRDAPLPVLVEPHLRPEGDALAKDIFRAFKAYLKEHDIPSEFQRW